MIYILKHSTGEYPFFAYDTKTGKRTKCCISGQDAFNRILSNLVILSLEPATLEECMDDAEKANHDRPFIVDRYSAETHPEYFI